MLLDHNDSDEPAALVSIGNVPAPFLFSATERRWDDENEKCFRPYSISRVSKAVLRGGSKFVGDPA